MKCLIAAGMLVASDNNVDVERIDFHYICAAAGLLGRDQCGAAACIAIQYDAAAFRAVENRIGDQRGWFDRRMHRQVIHSAGAHCIDTGVVPNVGAVAAMTAKLDIINVSARAIFENENQFMLER